MTFEEYCHLIITFYCIKELFSKSFGANATLETEARHVYAVLTEDAANSDCPMLFIVRVQFCLHMPARYWFFFLEKFSNGTDAFIQ